VFGRVSGHCSGSSSSLIDALGMDECAEALPATDIKALLMFQSPKYLD
jgi:hypothetical protein